MIDTGNTAFVLISSALVAIMTPGLAFFYGGLVKRKNVLTIMMQSFISMGIVTVLWAVLTFSRACCLKAIGGFSGLIEGNTDQFLANIYGTAISVAFSFLATYIILSILKAVMNIGVNLSEEDASLDRALHGEEAYDF